MSGKNATINRRPPNPDPVSLLAVKSSPRHILKMTSPGFLDACRQWLLRGG